MVAEPAWAGEGAEPQAEALGDPARVLLPVRARVKYSPPLVPLRAAQLFVRTPSLDALAEALGPALQRPPEGATFKLVAVLAGSEGWATLVLERIDYQLAKRLSEQLPGEVLALDLDGARLFLQVRRFTRGEAGRLSTEPLGRDVEVVAWDLLASLGVPEALRLLPLSSVETVEADHEEALPALLVEMRHEKIEVWAVGAIPPTRAADAPVEPDLLVESAAGEARALEVRRLPAVPATAQLAEALVAIEEAQAQRIARKLAASTDDERIPRPAFAYEMQQAAKLEPLLQAARAQRPWMRRLLASSPLSHAGFTARCRAAIESACGAPVARAHALRLELASGLRVPLAAPYAKYLESLDESSAIRAVVDALRARLALRPPPLGCREAALPGLLPVVAGPSLAADRAFAEVAGNLRAALVHDDGGRILPIRIEDLAALELGPEDAFQHAVDNLDARTLAAPGGLTWFDLEHGRVVVSDFDDAAGASRLLTPKGREMILHILDTDACLAAAPTRDTLLACERDDPDALAWLREEAQRRFEEGPFPALPDLLRLTEEGLDPVAAEDLAASRTE